MDFCRLDGVWLHFAGAVVSREIGDPDGGGAGDANHRNATGADWGRDGGDGVLFWRIQIHDVSRDDESRP